MKKLLLILLLFSFSITHAQEVPSNDPALAKELIEKFVEEGLKNDFYATHHIYTHLAGVYFIPGEDFQKLFTKIGSDDACVGLKPNYDLLRYERRLYINEKYKAEYRRGNLHAITAHELAHFFGLDHEKFVVPDLMNPILSSEFTMSDEEYTRLFRKIKHVAPVNYMLTIKF